jgi:acyl-CoA thioesterase-1
MIATVILLILLPVLVVARAFMRLRRPPRQRPTAGRTRVVCFGASTIQGNVSFNIVDELARRLPDHDVINAGINGNTSAQVLDRLPAVVALRPDVVVVHAGANDLLAALRDGGETTVDVLAANLRAIVAGLRPTGARIALMSIQPIGERLDDEFNRGVDRVNATIRQVAEAEQVAYLPLNERLAALLRGQGTGRAAKTDLLRLVVKAIVLHLGVGVGLDRIGRRNGFVLHTDGLHLASPGGLVAADLIEAFIRPQ